MTHLDIRIAADPTQRKMLTDFLAATGYGPSDILSLSYETQTFLTRNGGKYRLWQGKILHLAGPPPDPSDRI